MANFYVTVKKKKSAKCTYLTFVVKKAFKAGKVNLNSIVISLTFT